MSDLERQDQSEQWVRAFNAGYKAATMDLLANGERIWRCDEHNADFLEKSPDEYSICMAMLHENAWDALPEPEPCRPVKVVVVHPTTEEET